MADQVTQEKVPRKEQNISRNHQSNIFGAKKHFVKRREDCLDI